MQSETALRFRRALGIAWLALAVLTIGSLIWSMRQVPPFGDPNQTFGLFVAGMAFWAFVGGGINILWNMARTRKGRLRPWIPLVPIVIGYALVAFSDVRASRMPPNEPSEVLVLLIMAVWLAGLVGVCLLETFVFPHFVMFEEVEES